MTQMKYFSRMAGAVTFLTIFSVSEVFAVDPPTPAKGAETLQVQTSDADEAGTLPEKIDVQAMKKRYWTVGNEDLMDVVQNRQYVKKGRIEIAPRYGFYSDDPFVDSSTLSFSLGYHFNEFFSLHGIYSKIDWSESAAFKTATTSANGLQPIVNPSTSFIGVEGRGSLLYGKLSMLGNAIFYYDFNIALGAGKLKNVAGDSPTAIYGGLGQEFYISKTFFLSVDYRLLMHSDKFASSAAPTVFNVSRSVTSSWVQVGFGAFLF